MKAQHRMLLLVAALAVSVIAIPRAHATSGGPIYVSVDLRNAPFEEALRQLFSGSMLRHANYVVESEPPEGVLATVRVTKKGPSEALSLVLREYGMTYRWVNRTVYISPQGAYREPQPRLILYLRRNGDRTQLRLRAYPYESGGEKLLWESPKDVTQFAYCLPSPSFKYVAVSWFGRSYDPTPTLGPRLMLIPLTGGEATRITPPQAVNALMWTETDKLKIVGRGDTLWRFDPSTGELTDQSPKNYATLDLASAAQVQKLGEMLDRVEAPVAFPRGDLEAVVRTGLWDSHRTRQGPRAAVSPDGQYAALVGAEAAVYILDIATGAVRQKILATQLIDTEQVTLGQLHWSQDSVRLLFTETHFHFARRKVQRPYGTPGASDWTDIVREYSLSSDRGQTLTVGYDAHEVPAEAAAELLAASDPKEWESADDQWRWGVNASKEDVEWTEEERQRTMDAHEASMKAAAERAAAEDAARARRERLYGGLVGAGVVLAGGGVVMIAVRRRRGPGGGGGFRLMRWI